MSDIARVAGVLQPLDRHVADHQVSGSGTHPGEAEPTGDKGSAPVYLAHPTTRDGFPATIANGGTSKSTKVAVPMTAPSPIVTGPTICARTPIHTLSPIATSAEPSCSGKRSSKHPGGPAKSESLIMTSY